MTTQEATKQTVVAFVRALDAGDLAALRALLAPDATWEVRATSPGAGMHAGADAIVGEFLPMAFSAFKPASVSLALGSLIAEGESAAAEWVMTGETAAGQPYSNVYHVAFHVLDGQITEIREYLDSLYLTRTLFSAV